MGMKDKGAFAMNTAATSLNGHETKGQLAARNLRVRVEQLREMRWMVESIGCLKTFDLAVSSLEEVLQEIDEEDRRTPD